jgi:hypothetical protein
MKHAIRTITAAASVALGLTSGPSAHAGDLYFICADQGRGPDAEEIFLANASLDMEKAELDVRFQGKTEAHLAYDVSYSHKSRRMKVVVTDMRKSRTITRMTTLLEANRPMMVSQTVSCGIQD